jgi:hypothetical protein
LQVKNSGTNSNLNFPRILKGFKPFWKNLINSSKFHLHMICLNILLHWLTCIQILEVSLQVVKMTVKFVLNVAGHLEMLDPLTQVHHWSKFGKEYSKQSSKYYSLIRLTCIQHIPKLKKICNFQKCYPLSNFLEKPGNWSLSYIWPTVAITPQHQNG